MTSHYLTWTTISTYMHNLFSFRTCNALELTVRLGRRVGFPLPASLVAAGILDVMLLCLRALSAVLAAGPALMRNHDEAESSSSELSVISKLRKMAASRALRMTIYRLLQLQRVVGAKIKAPLDLQILPEARRRQQVQYRKRNQLTFWISITLRFTIPIRLYSLASF